MRARRTDQNQAEVVELLRTCGCKVWIIQEPCDLLAFYPKIGLFLIECKGADKRERGKNQDQLSQLKAEGLPYAVVRRGESVTAALDELLALRQSGLRAVDPERTRRSPLRR